MENRSAILPTQGLLLARDMTAHGLESQLKSAAARGAVTRIRRGAYADTVAVETWEAAERYRTTVSAVLATRSNAVAAGLSAAVLHGLPMLGQWPDSVHVLAPGSSGRRRNGVVEIPRRDGERVIQKEGFAATSLLDTLIEVSRTARFLTALTMVDAAVRIDRYGKSEPLCTLEALHRAIGERRPFQGMRRVQRVLDFATTGADTPFETLSRVVIHELGFPAPVPQYPIQIARDGTIVFCDFGWPDYRIDGEADGWGKYVNPEYGPDIEPAERVRLEKRRENRVRARDWGVSRWEWDDAWYPARLRSILLEAGLPLVRRPCSLR